MAGDGRTGEFDNGGDVIEQHQPEQQQQQQHELFVVVVFDNAGSADADDGDLLCHFFFCVSSSSFFSLFSPLALFFWVVDGQTQSSNVDHRFYGGRLLCEPVWCCSLRFAPIGNALARQSYSPRHD